MNSIFVNFIFCGFISLFGENMAIVKVDERGRMMIPKEMGVRETRAVIISVVLFL